MNVKNPNSLLLCAIFLCLAFSGCKKDEKESSGPQTNTEKLIGTWKVTANTATTSSGTIDYYSFKSPCEKDDKIIFKSGGILSTDEGPTKCNSGDPQTETGTWAWQSGETKLQLYCNGLPSDLCDVDQNDGAVLKVSYTYNGGTSSEVKYKYTLKKQ